MADSNEYCVELRGDFEYDTMPMNDELLCSICKSAFVQPVESEVCDHTFCQSCISEWLGNYGTCPICRAVLDDDNLVQVKSKIVLNQLDRIPVKCSRCGKINIIAHREHLMKCPKKIVPCSAAADLKCPWRGPRDESQLHSKTCIYQQLRPILEQYNMEIERLKTQQSEQKGLLKLIVNNGYPMHANCIMANCFYQNLRVANDPSAFICTNCRFRLSSHTEMALHSCHGGCICRSCSKRHNLTDDIIRTPPFKMMKSNHPQP